MRKHARSYYLIEHNQQLPELEPKASNHNEVNSNNQFSVFKSTNFQ